MSRSLLASRNNKSVQPLKTEGTSQVIITENIGNGWDFENEWKYGLSDVCVDSKLCVCAFFCPLCFQCELFTRVGECLCTPVFAPFSLYALRTKMRTGFRIKGSTFNDFLVTLFCTPCSVIQMQNELNAQNC